MTFSSEVITLEVRDHVATLWLDRPASRNALGGAFWRDFPLATQALRDENVRVVVVAAKGPHFSVGLDLKEFGADFMTSDTPSSQAASHATRYREIKALQDSVSSLASLEVPVIAAVHGYCIGGGVDLICACDIRLGSSDALFSIRETKVAIVADLGTLQRLPRIVGAGHVAELAYTGRDFDAAHAARIGLLNDVRGDDAGGVLRAAYQLANEIAQNSPLAVRGTKAVLSANDGRTIDEGLDFVATWNTMYLRSDDLREAMTAFLERREPKYRGT